MTTTTNAPRRYHIGDLLLDEGPATVSRGGLPLNVSGLTYDLLRCLVRHAPNVVTTQTLLDEVWGEVIVGDETLKQRIKLLRKALAEEGHAVEYIQSVRGRGYRLVAKVRTADTDRRRSSAVVAALAALMLVGIATVFIINQPANQEETSPVTVSAVQARRLLVMPFENYSGQTENDYLAEGITEDMITALARVEGLGVIARTTAMSYRGSRQPISAIAAELNVGTVVEGSVQQAGDMLRITVQMIDAASEEHYWAQDFSVSMAEIGELQVDVARRVAGSLQMTLAGSGVEAIQRGMTASPEAFDAYLRGRAFYRRWTAADNGVAIGFYEQAIDLDPEFALAIAGLANAFALRAGLGGGFEWIEAARTQAQRALRLQPDLPEAYKALGITNFVTGRLQESLADSLEAVELNPTYDEALFNVAEVYHLMGEWDKAIQFQLRDADRPQGVEMLSIYLRDAGLHAEADELLKGLNRQAPVSFSLEQNLSLHALFKSEFDNARTHATRNTIAFPENIFSWQRAAEVELWTGNLSAAEDYMRQAVELAAGQSPYTSIRLAQIRLALGDAEADDLLRAPETESLASIEAGHEAWYHPWNLALLYSLRGETEQAISWFERAVEAGRVRWEWDEWEPGFDSIRHLKRFQVALEQQRSKRARILSNITALLAGRH
jgi:TolB-like protein/DNA-binding winged helix-turn-helix (wHTH) protein